MDLRFITSNQYKVEEARKILAGAGVRVIHVPLKIEELQTINTSRLIEHKALEAFQRIGRPLFVEHTVLRLSKLNDFPGGLTQIFWDTLEADLFSELFKRTAVVAETIIGFVDGRKLHIFRGEIRGMVADSPRGPRGFQWDCVFTPEGHDQTFAELGEAKNQISMRRKALDGLARFLDSPRGA
jgi:XTP/dITP diphosphohydrolase